MRLIVEGGFKSSPALRLCLAHGFAVIGMLGTAVMLKVDDESLESPGEQIIRHIPPTLFEADCK